MIIKRIFWEIVSILSFPLMVFMNYFIEPKSSFIESIKKTVKMRKDLIKDFKK